MAVGYSRIPSVQVLIDAGADPERPDKKGRTVIALVEDLRKAMPLTAELMGRRSMLEQVMGVLTGGHHGAGASTLVWPGGPGHLFKQGCPVQAACGPGVAGTNGSMLAF